MTLRRLRIACAACALALLAACGSDRPPAGFEAVAPAGSKSGPTTCPDLTGTFDLAGTSLAEIAGRKPPNTYGLPVLLTFKPGPTNIEGWWVVPRERLVAFAKTMSEDTPERYARWRGLVLKEHLPETLRQNFDAYLAAVAELGPPGPVYALVAGRDCRDSWMLVSSGTYQVAGDDGTKRAEDREIWLARDASGALLVKRVAYRLKSYTIWASATQSIRTSSITTYERVPQAGPESAEPLAAADLPTDPRTRPRALMPCAEVAARADQLSQRLRDMIPPKAQITRFELNPIRQQDADGNCPYAVVNVEIVGGDPYFLARTEGWLRLEPGVASVEALPAETGRPPGTTRRYRVVLH